MSHCSCALIGLSLVVEVVLLRCFVLIHVIVFRLFFVFVLCLWLSPPPPLLSFGVSLLSALLGLHCISCFCLFFYFLGGVGVVLPLFSPAEANSLRKQTEEKSTFTEPKLRILGKSCCLVQPCCWPPSRIHLTHVFLQLEDGRAIPPKLIFVVFLAIP